MFEKKTKWQIFKLKVIGLIGKIDDKLFEIII